MLKDLFLPLKVESLFSSFFFLYFFSFLNFIYLFIFSCAGSLLLHRLFSSFSEWELLSSCSCSDLCCRGAWALGYVGFSSWGAWAHQLRLPGSRAQAQQLQHMDFAALWHVGSSTIRGSNSCLLHWHVDSFAARENLFSSLISFIKVLQLYSYKSFTYFGKFMPKDFSFFWVLT